MGKNLLLEITGELNKNYYEYISILNKLKTSLSESSWF